MSEAAPKDHGDNAEIGGLVADLELQIEALSAGLNKLRGTVARLSYASLAAHVALIEPASAGSVSTPAEPVETPAVLVAPPPPQLPNWLPTPAYQQDPEAAEVVPEPGFWDSVAEGASWPRSRSLEAPAEGLEAATELTETPAATGLPAADEIPDQDEAPASQPAGWMASPLRAEGLVEALKATAAESEWEVVEPFADGEPEPLAWPPSTHTIAAIASLADAAAGDLESAPDDTEPETPAPAWTAWHPETPPATLSTETPAANGELASPPEAFEPAAAPEPPSIWERWQAAAPLASSPAPAAAMKDATDPGPASHEEPAPEATLPAGAEAAEPADSPLPKALSFGWPDESIWSQSYEWKPMQPKDPPPSRSPETDPARAGVSDIVAQVRAELEAARSQMPEPDVAPAADSLPPPAAETFTAAAASDTPLGETPATDIPDAADDTTPAASAWDAAAPGVADAAVTSATDEPDVAADTETDDATKRDEVSRAVEEIKRQMQAGGFGFDAATGESGDAAAPGEGGLTALALGRDGQGERPAFRLAAPGSLPDWSQVPLEPAGPPVVVIKDADGRVELASVFETLNEIGCGDGAALLNYTPHSVTVGLPASAPVPTTGQFADAVEMVFGLASRVESVGVRITVSIGVDRYVWIVGDVF
jgi:hypothetical protein